MSKRLLLAGVVLSAVVLGAISASSWPAPVKPAIAYNQIQTTHTQKWFVGAVAPTDTNISCAWFREMVLPTDFRDNEFGVLLASLK